MLGNAVQLLTRSSHPLVDLRLFKDRTFAMSSTMLVLVVISVFGSFLLLPLYFQTVRGESALAAGLLLAPQGLGAMLAMPSSTALFRPSIWPPPPDRTML